MDDWSHLLQGKLRVWVEHIFGRGYYPEEAVQLRGGAQKVVYKVRCSNGFYFILYIWDLRMNYFREELEQEEQSESISGFGGKQFQTVNAYLSKLQVRTPEIYHFEPGELEGKADFAFVEYIEGKEASDFFQAAPEIQDQVFESLSGMLYRMHQQTRAYWGKLHEPIPDEPSGCHLPMLAKVNRQLEYLSAYVPEFRNHHDNFVQVIDDLAAKIETRSCYSFIHAELGPNHVLIDNQLRPWLIDIEGALFFDPEYEHSFMEFRFDNYGRYLKNSRLDPNRMTFYKLYHHISFSAGPHRLLQRGYPDAEIVKQIMVFNTQSAFRILEDYL
ncbi:phosphotransferase [Paenibacillus lutimineralis]|uniref:Aminoglycoside phosphotransferase family protein n=1 Tax=Paenibacillus lutimineralis TaxID=2707005 RepID=A0A3S9UVH9_9BACL|nr:phosphotransferase [Paenibacillus lutimineralis]AZS14335.1 aminoglycoside phosphotransferase family protein [Paenibacillus lutimineralis]